MKFPCRTKAFRRTAEWRNKMVQSPSYRQKNAHNAYHFVPSCRKTKSSPLTWPKNGPSLPPGPCRVVDGDRDVSGDDLLAASDGGSTGAGGGAMILGSALWPCCVTLRPKMSHRGATHSRGRHPVERMVVCGQWRVGLARGGSSC